MKNLFESFNGFAEDSLVSLNESADAMYLNLCLKKVSTLIKKYDGVISNVTSSFDSVSLAGKLVQTVVKYNGNTVRILEESARHILNCYAREGHFKDSFMNILVDFDDIDSVVKQIKRDYSGLSDGFKSHIKLDFEPYKEGLISIGFVVKVKYYNN